MRKAPPAAAHPLRRPSWCAPAAPQTRSALPCLRIGTLDLLRGFALMGILLMNMPGFSSSAYAEADAWRLWAGRLDLRAEQLTLLNGWGFEL